MTIDAEALEQCADYFARFQDAYGNITVRAIDRPTFTRCAAQDIYGSVAHIMKNRVVLLIFNVYFMVAAPARCSAPARSTRSTFFCAVARSSVSRPHQPLALRNVLAVP